MGSGTEERDDSRRNSVNSEGRNVFRRLEHLPLVPALPSSPAFLEVSVAY